MLAVDGATVDVVVRDLPILELSGGPAASIFLNVGDSLLKYSSGTLETVFRSRRPIAFFRVNDRGSIACLVGEPPRWDLVVVFPDGHTEDVDTRGLQDALWLTGGALLLRCASTGGRTGTTRFLLKGPASTPTQLFSTTIMLKAEIIVQGARVFASGAVYGGAQRGAWLFDPQGALPFRSVIDVLPEGAPTFLGESVVFGATVNHSKTFIVLTDGSAQALPIEQPLPTKLAPAPDRISVVWAEVTDRGGKLWCCRVLP
jgi:hypothetical protein